MSFLIEISEQVTVMTRYESVPLSLLSDERFDMAYSPLLTH
jgi:hypothetical protein